jgi:hypothetical protein
MIFRSIDGKIFYVPKNIYWSIEWYWKDNKYIVTLHVNGIYSAVLFTEFDKEEMLKRIEGLADIAEKELIDG